MQDPGKSVQIEHVDASKLADFQKCPKLFDYKHVQGYQAKGDKIDLIFGTLLGEALEIFEKALFKGETHDDAHKRALTHVLAGARNDDGSSKFGSFLGTWRCVGDKPYKNEKGNQAKCPYSHKGKYFPLPAPDICSCGAATEKHDLWMPVKAGKDLDRLIELLVGYTDGALSRNLIPQQLDGKPLIEHYWETEFDHPALLRPVMLCGNWDAVKKFGNEAFVVDYKTTGKSIGETYWRGFSPNVQVDLYNMAARKILPGLDIRGVAIEAFSTAGGPGFRLFKATDAQKAEMFGDTAFWIGLKQNCEATGVWPRNRANCFMCPFQTVCSRDPADRQKVLSENFEIGFWNPQLRRLERPDAEGMDTAGRNPQEDVSREGTGRGPSDNAVPPGDGHS